MLEVNNISRCYGDFLAVDNVSFSIGKGDIVGLLGHNGAGKTTIMKMISGFLEPNSGSIDVSGVDLIQHSKLAQKNIGYLPESLPTYLEMTVVDYLDYVAEIKGLEGQNKTDEIKHAIKATDIREKLFHSIDTLSRGFKQRVGVAQAILGQPKLLILDEPTNGLDPTQTEQMRQLIQRIAKASTVILSTHIMQEVEALCNRVLIVRSGELIVDVELDTLRAASNCIQLMSNMPEKQARKLFSEIEGVTQIEMPKEGEFEIQVDENVDMQAVKSELAKNVVTNHFDLYQLQLMEQNLEDFFRNATSHQAKDSIPNQHRNKQGGLSHVA